MHERAPQSPEKYEREDRPQPVFDLRQMTPDQIAGLIAALGLANDADLAAQEEGNDDSERRSNVGLISLLERELKNLASEAPDKAMETYAALMNHSRVWPRELATYCLGTALVQRHIHDREASQRILGPWLEMLNHPASSVREAAYLTIDKVYCSDWIDEHTARYLDSRRPADLVVEKRLRDDVEES